MILLLTLILSNICTSKYQKIKNIKNLADAMFLSAKMSQNIKSSQEHVNRNFEKCTKPQLSFCSQFKNENINKQLHAKQPCKKTSQWLTHFNNKESCDGNHCKNLNCNFKKKIINKSDRIFQSKGITTKNAIIPCLNGHIRFFSSDSTYGSTEIPPFRSLENFLSDDKLREKNDLDNFPIQIWFYLLEKHEIIHDFRSRLMHPHLEDYRDEINSAIQIIFLTMKTIRDVYNTDLWCYLKIKEMLASCDLLTEELDAFMMKIGMSDIYACNEYLNQIAESIKKERENLTKQLINTRK